MIKRPVDLSADVGRIGHGKALLGAGSRGAPFRSTRRGGPAETESVEPTLRATPKDIFLGRQPICDSALQVQGYELLYRGSEQVGTGQTSPEMASATVALNLIIEIGLDRVVGDQLAFIRMTRAFLVDGQYRALPPEQIVLEILEDIEPDAEVLREVRFASELGYRIALGDFIHHQRRLEPLIELADFVKVELLDQDPDSIREHVRLLRRPGLKVLAEKVETPEQFELCRDAGYDLFQPPPKAMTPSWLPVR